MYDLYMVQNILKTWLDAGWDWGRCKRVIDKRWSDKSKKFMTSDPECRRLRNKIKTSNYKRGG